MNKFDVFRLKNGIRVVLIDLPHLNSVTVEVFLKIGSAYEYKDEFGISHVWEHMAFKETKKRSARDINIEIDSRGAIHNAGTGFEMTSYQITTVKRDVLWAIDILADILINPTFPEDELNRELGVVKEEIKMYEDNPTMGLSFDLVQLLYGESKRGCWNIAGSLKDVSSIDREKLLNYRKKYFNGEGTVIVIAGGLGVKKEIKRKIEEVWLGLGKGVGVTEELVVSLGKLKTRTKKKTIDQAHFCLGVPTVGRDDNRKYVATLIEQLMAGNSSSNLYEEIRHKRGWAYYVFSLGQLLARNGYLGVQAGVNKDKIDEVVSLTKEAYLSLAETIKEGDLKRVKDFVVGKGEMGLDKTNFWTDFVGRRLLLDDEVANLGRELAKMKAVSLKEVKEFGKSFFRKDKFRLVVAKD
ncbi:hypothetical protein DRH14_00410 [Candidatus Shapirobacteria bacterium]|nr:MAG: hypothetical protein DRH14_00410 [Candidatus Shapirobacteria bacterium]